MDGEEVVTFCWVQAITNGSGCGGLITMQYSPRIIPVWNSTPFDLPTKLNVGHNKQWFITCNDRSCSLFRCAFADPRTDVAWFIDNIPNSA